jgi:hypothetical protein
VGNYPDPGSHEAGKIAIESPQSVVGEVIEGRMGVIDIVKPGLPKFSSRVDGGQ